MRLFVRSVATFLTVCFSSYSFAALNMDSVVGTWKGEGVLSKNGKVVCQKAAVTWKISVDEVVEHGKKARILSLDPNTTCPATGEDFGGMPAKARLADGGKIFLKILKIQELDAGKYSDNSLDISLNVFGALKLIAQLGPIDNGKAKIKVSSSMVLMPTIEITADLVKQ